MILDIAVALLLTHAVFSHDALLWQYLLSCALVLFPDIDMLSFVLPARYRAFFGGHRGLTHYPIMSLLVVCFVWYALGLLWALIAAMLLLWHFVHDTFFLGWGVPWAAPFSLRRYKFFPDKDGKILPIPLLTWMPEEDAMIRQQYGTSDWVRRYYFSYSWNAVLEYGALVLAILYLSLY